MTEVDPHDLLIRSREIIFSPADELAYADLLVRAFPNVRFLDCPSVLPRGEKPPETTVRSLAECRSDDTYIVFDPDWRPTWTCDPGPREADRWYLKNAPIPNGSWDRCGNIGQRKQYESRPDSKEIESIGSQEIYFRIAPRDKGQEALAAKALRLIGKMASTGNMLTLRMPAMEIAGPPRSIEYWIGHDARRWCLEKPNRTLGGSWDEKRGGWARRPADPEGKDRT